MAARHAALIAALCLLVAPGLAQQPAAPARPSDHTQLLYYRNPAGQERRITSAEEWLIRRRSILAGMEEAMGPLPDRKDLPPLDLKILKVVEEERFTRLSVSFTSEKTPAEDRIPALLLIPRGAQKNHRRAAILALHQTAPQGKGDVTIAGPQDQGYGAELAGRGYVVLCPDYPSFGDYRYDFQSAFKSGRYASGTMKGIFNHMRCVDLLQSLAEVDPERIGVIGHSLGGHNAIFVAVFDQRIKAVVSSCGWTPFPDYYQGKIAGWTSDRYMPRLREVYRLDPRAVPFDFPELIAALAPRPFFSNSPLHDANFDVDGVKKGVAEARRIYELLGAQDALRVVHPDCAHAFPTEIRQKAYEFLDETLKRKDQEP